MMSVLKMYYCKRKEKKNTSTFHQPVCFSSLLEPQQKDWTTDPSSPAHRHTWLTPHQNNRQEKKWSPLKWQSASTPAYMSFSTVQQINESWKPFVFCLKHCVSLRWLHSFESILRITPSLVCLVQLTFSTAATVDLKKQAVEWCSIQGDFTATACCLLL